MLKLRYALDQQKERSALAETALLLVTCAWIVWEAVDLSLIHILRYVLLLLTLLTAGFSVWYYQNRISPEGKELAAQKTTLEQELSLIHI